LKVLIYPNASVGGKPNTFLGVRGAPVSSRKKAYKDGEKPWMEKVLQ